MTLSDGLVKLRRIKYLPICCIIKIVAKKLTGVTLVKLLQHKKLHLFTIILLAMFQLQHKKITFCIANICSSKRITKQPVTKQEGEVGNYIINNDRRWMINFFINSGSGLKMTCIICGDIPDSLKIMTKRVVFSGELKDACGIADNEEEQKKLLLHLHLFVKKSIS